jgi:hypothetical protein
MVNNNLINKNGSLTSVYSFFLFLFAGILPFEFVGIPSMGQLVRYGDAVAALHRAQHHVQGEPPSPMIMIPPVPFLIFSFFILSPNSLTWTDCTLKRSSGAHDTPHVTHTPHTTRMQHARNAHDTTLIDRCCDGRV